METCSAKCCREVMKNTHGDRRRRFAKACDPCRKRKLRCDGIRPICSRCQGGKTACHYADVHKPQRRVRGSVPAPSDASPELLQDHVASNQSDVPEVQLSPNASVDTSVITGTVPSSPRTCRHHDTPSTSHLDVSNKTSFAPATYSVSPDTVVGSSGDMRYFGPPSGVSLTSIGAIRKLPQSTSTFPKNTPHNESWTAWTHPCMQAALEIQPKNPLPPWKDAFSLVSEFFDHEHQVIPCFNQPTFMALLGQQYSGKSNQNPAWLASLNAVLAIAQRRRVERGEDPPLKEDLAWGYAANAMGKLLEILMRNTQLLSVQALLCMAWFFVGTPNPQPSFMLTGSALRLAHSIGLHTSYHDASWDSIELEMRKRVFWIAISLDSELCIRTGRPPAHNLHDFHVGLPPDSIHNLDNDIITTTNGSTLDLFKAQTRLSIIQGKIYKKLYSGKPASAENNHIADSISQLTQELEGWASTISSALDMRQPVLNVEHHGLMRLCYVYYNCIIVTNRGLGIKYWTSCDPEPPLELSSSTEDSVQRCVKAARCIMALDRVIPHEWKSFYWDIIGISSSAIIILCINALRRPGEISATEDLCAVTRTFNIFDVLNEEHPNTYLRPLRMACEKLFRRAQTAAQSLGADPSLESHCSDFRLNRHERPPMETEPASGLAINANNPTQTLEQQTRDKEPLSSPRTNSNHVDSQWDGWTADQPLLYPSLTPWSLDMLLTDSFTNFY